MRPQSDCSGCTDQNQAVSGPSEWMTVAEMQEYMHAGRTKAYEVRAMLIAPEASALSKGEASSCRLKRTRNEADDE